ITIAPAACSGFGPAVRTGWFACGSSVVVGSRSAFIRVLSPMTSQHWNDELLGEQLRRDLRDVPALEAGDRQLVGAWQAFALRAGDRRRAVRSAAGDLVQVQQLLRRIGNAGDDHALVVEERVQADDGRLLSAVLAGGGG